MRSLDVHDIDDIPAGLATGTAIVKAAMRARRNRVSCMVMMMATRSSMQVQFGLRKAKDAVSGYAWAMSKLETLHNGFDVTSRSQRAEVISRVLYANGPFEIAREAGI